MAENEISNPRDLAIKGDVISILDLISTAKNPNGRAEGWSCMPEAVESAAKKGDHVQFEAFASWGGFAKGKASRQHMAAVVVKLNELDPNGTRSMGDETSLANNFPHPGLTVLLSEKCRRIAKLLEKGPLEQASKADDAQKKVFLFNDQQKHVPTSRLIYRRPSSLHVESRGGRTGYRLGRS